MNRMGKLGVAMLLCAIVLAGCAGWAQPAALRA